MYGKKKHYNARDRYAAYHEKIGITIIVITAFMGTSVYYSLSENSLLLIKIVTGFLTVAVAVLAALQTFLNFEKKAFSHKATADRYLWLMKEAQLILSYYRDGSKTVTEVQKIMGDFFREIKNIQTTEPETSIRDYRNARESVENDEETYTDNEKI